LGPKLGEVGHDSREGRDVLVAPRLNEHSELAEHNNLRPLKFLQPGEVLGRQAVEHLLGPAGLGHIEFVVKLLNSFLVFSLPASTQGLKIALYFPSLLFGIRGPIQQSFIPHLSIFTRMGALWKAERIHVGASTT